MDKFDICFCVLSAFILEIEIKSDELVLFARIRHGSKSPPEIEKGAPF